MRFGKERKTEARVKVHKSVLRVLKESKIGFPAQSDLPSSWRSRGTNIASAASCGSCKSSRRLLGGSTSPRNGATWVFTSYFAKGDWSRVINHQACLLWNWKASSEFWRHENAIYIEEANRSIITQIWSIGLYWSIKKSRVNTWLYIKSVTFLTFGSAASCHQS